MLQQKVIDFIGGNPIVENYSKFKIKEVLDMLDPGTKVLIAFFHGMGDTLMFLPLYRWLQTLYQYSTGRHIQFSLALGPGFGQKVLCPDAIEIPKVDFLKDHDIAFVLAFPMVEGINGITKAEYCCKAELGIPFEGLQLIPRSDGPTEDRPFVAVHFQGTCLPGSTNPDEVLAKRIWDDITEAGYIPIDVHFKHVFHNPANKDWSFLTRTCRDLKPDINQLRNVISSCYAFIGVASGPFVLALATMPNRTIYLQKNHDIGCYVKGFGRVVDINNYDKEVLLKHLREINP